MAAKKKKQSAKAAPRSATPMATPAAATPVGSRSTREPIDLSRALLNAWRVNERINQQLIDLIAPHIWRAFPTSSKRRNIATSFAHIHNVRCMRIKMCHSSVAAPDRLDRAELTPDDARKALAVSADAMTALIRLGLDATRRGKTDILW